MSPAQRVNHIFAVYHQLGHRHYGEDVTELQHALQTAAFAKEHGEGNAVIAAALLHDYGHLGHNAGEDIAERGVDMRHETLGAIKLAGVFPAEVLDPIRLHVAAKRYLCWKEPGYLVGLSAASQLSLQLQGGPMSEAEAEEFEREPHYEAAVRLRRYDDMGKVPGMEVRELESYRELLESLVIG
jgi:phosphonate degradation associated HDIG domain protein